MFRPAESGKKSVYNTDYEPISIIKGAADEYGVSILIVHHLRKSASDDVFDNLSGAFGLTGATDSNIVLERKTGNSGPSCTSTGATSRARNLQYVSNRLPFRGSSWEKPKT